MEPIAVGQKAPEFSVKDHLDQEVMLSEFRGQKVLLSFHPLAWTRVCKLQMQGLEENRHRLQALNTVPLGFSVDPLPSKKAWAENIGVENVSLPSDFWPHGQVADAYGVFRPEHGVSGRANILVDEGGTVIWVKVYPTREVPDLEEVIAFLSQ